MAAELLKSYKLGDICSSRGYPSVSSGPGITCFQSQPTGHAAQAHCLRWSCLHLCVCQTHGLKLHVRPGAEGACTSSTARAARLTRRVLEVQAPNRTSISAATQTLGWSRSCSIGCAARLCGGSAPKQNIGVICDLVSLRSATFQDHLVFPSFHTAQTPPSCQVGLRRPFFVSNGLQREWEWANVTRNLGTRPQVPTCAKHS